MAYTEVTRTSYGSRLKNSLGGIFIGLLMFLGGTYLLWWNEGRAVKTTNMLNDAEQNYVEMENISKVDPEFNGQLIHASGLATTSDSLSDPTFNIGAVAVKLNRQVEYYQWTEESKSEKKDKIGGAQETITTYTYSKDWTQSPVNSANFKDPDYQGVNFVYSQMEDNTKKAANVAFGAYRLNDSQISSFHNPQPVNISLSEDIIQSLEKACLEIRKSRGIEETANANDSLKVAPANELRYVHVSGNVIYIGRSPQVPEIGDVRITFTKDDPAKVSIMAKVNGDSFSSYKAKNGKLFSILYMGEMSAEEMLESERSTNSMILWLLRVLGVIIIIAGLRSIVSIVPTLLKVLPFLGNIVETGLGLVCGIIGLVWSLIIIALAWLWYRPVVGIILLLIAGALIFWLVQRSRKKKAGTSSPTPEQNYKQPEVIKQPEFKQQTESTPESEEFKQWQEFQKWKKQQGGEN